MEKQRKEEKNDVVLVDQQIKKDQFHLVELRTGKSRHVKLGGEHVVDFSWSPDGKQIAYSDEADGGVEIFVADADGKNRKQLTKAGSTSSAAQIP